MGKLSEAKSRTDDPVENPRIALASFNSSEKEKRKKAMMNSEHNLLVGTLVQWTGGKGYGVITHMDDKIVQVYWDDTDADIPPQFAATDPPLVRVDLRGQPAQRRSTGQEVFVLKPVEATEPAWQCRVLLQGFNTNILEVDLRPLPVTDPLERFRTGNIESAPKSRFIFM